MSELGPGNVLDLCLRDYNHCDVVDGLALVTIL
jgi:hypothetical protein